MLHDLLRCGKGRGHRATCPRSCRLGKAGSKPTPADLLKSLRSGQASTRLLLQACSFPSQPDSSLTTQGMCSCCCFAEDRDVRHPGAGITSGYEAPGVGAGN